MRDRRGLDFSTVFHAGPAIAWMDLARAYCRMGRDVEGFDALVHAVDTGWSDAAALDDAVFDALRERPEFDRLGPLLAERAQLPDEVVAAANDDATV